MAKKVTAKKAAPAKSGSVATAKNQTLIIKNQGDIKKSQASIIKNQGDIKKNQALILKNQNTILKNQSGIKANQNTIIGNQAETIIANQKEILELLRKIK